MRPATYQFGFAPRDGMPAYPTLWRNCVAAWAPCLGATGISLVDVAQKRNGVLNSMTGVAGFVMSSGRYSLDFNGAANLVILPDVRYITSAPSTISFWIRIRTNKDTIVFRLQSGPTLRFFDLGSGYHWRYSFLGVGDRDLTNNTYSTNDGKWHHCSFANDGTNVLCYFDGKYRESVLSPGTPSSSTTPNYIGAFGSSSLTLDGQIDDILIHSRPLDPAEIKLLAWRRGIAFERADRRRAGSGIAFNRRRRLLVGAGT